ncbi:hypothetical protein HU200_053045 [Digitaria exilis]|uniref:Uncharacterized protein n=1 Tax=Digitaria exilis TaxID=1010633 RepID=A0A835E3S4_9POAL|nr:hypothetical protein HU200_053045 [Digitaria exilis]
MPQLDLEHLVGVGASGHGEAGPAAHHAGDVGSSARAGDGNAPPESFLIRVRNGIGLAELLGAAAALRRDGSTKGSSNPKAVAEAAATTRKQIAPTRADSSRRSTASQAAAVVIGVLPTEAGKVVAAKERRVVSARAWRRPAAAGARVFASEAVGTEPVSPKVSCFGAVLPETTRAAAAAAAPLLGTREGGDERGGGCWASVAAALRGVCCSSEPREGEPPGASESDAKATAPEPAAAAVLMSPPMMVAGLGDVKRLASRRWTETMAAE